MTMERSIHSGSTSILTVIPQRFMTSFDAKLSWTKMTTDKIAKTIAITGASSGIGQEIALEMAPNGHSFFLMGRSKERLRSVQKEVEMLGGKAIIGIGDVSDAETVDRMYTTIQRDLGKVDVFVANAGVGHFGNLETLSIEEYDEQFNTNVEAFIEQLEERR